MANKNRRPNSGKENRRIKVKGERTKDKAEFGRQNKRGTGRRLKAQGKTNTDYMRMLASAL